MEFGLLGPLRVVDDAGGVVAVPAGKQRVVLACLALRAGELVTTDELAEAIWGSRLPDSPRRAVQTHLTRLRALDRLGEARAHWLEALAIFEQLGTSDAEQVRILLGERDSNPPR